MSLARDRSRGARAIQRELAISYTDALRIWEERNPDLAARAAVSRAAAREKAAARKPGVDIDGYFRRVLGVPLTTLDLEPPPGVPGAVVARVARRDEPDRPGRVRVTKEGAAVWEIDTNVKVTVQGRWEGPVEDAARDPRVRNVEVGPGWVTMAPRRARVTFHVKVAGNPPTLRYARTTWRWLDDDSRRPR